ncbi:MAG: HlyD family efflux transporter periplasmic adaptor subunit, partial [Anaerolineae bacterium]|nr:HlyD family efflux transporter periplasmic adaptor subunit [Anaerolineae bacterium]
ETRNVSELNIGRIRVGQEAIVRVMAFRGEELRGRVDAISPVAVVQQGDTTYTVFIELEPTDLNLRPGMNAEVAILTE